MNSHRLTGIACFAAVICTLALGIESIVLLSTRGDVSDNATNTQVAKTKAVVVGKKAAAVERKANRNAKRLTQVVRKVERTRVVVKQTRTVLRQKGILGATGRMGARGPGPTDGQVAAAVERYCNFHVCGRPPTVDQVVAGLKACSAGGGCRGQDGAAGRDAPPPTDEQISTAVEAYCATRNGCAGPTGLQGPPGAAAGPFTFSYQGPDGILHVCTIDTALGVEVVQPCAS